MSDPKLPGIGVALPDALTDALCDALYAIGTRRATLPSDISCQFCGARPGEHCVTPDRRSHYTRDDANHYADHESRRRAYLRLPNRDEVGADGH